MTEAPPKPLASTLALPAELDPHGPRPGRARAKGTAARTLVIIAATLSALVFVVSVGGYTVYRYFDGQIARIKLNLGNDRPAAGTGGAVNFLIVGSDSRAGTGTEFESEGAVDGERSDTTIVAHLAPDGTTTLVSFPRDTLVAIPGHGRGKLNSAITTGGPSLLIRTIERLTQLRIDHYVQVDLAGFRQITDAIGGVTVCVRALPDGSTANLHDPWSQWTGVVGANHLNGERALAFVRERHGLPDGDFDRIRRQQQFISAVFAKATSTGVLTNPVKLESLLQAAFGSLTVDDSTTIDDLQKLATRMHGLRPDQLQFETIPVRPPTPAEGANELGELPVYGSVQIYDQRTLDAFLAPLRGTPSPASSEPAATGGQGISAGPVSPRSDFKVDVFNATGLEGTAGRTASSLATAGFVVGAAQTWSGKAPATTQVRYPPGDEADARALGAVVPGASFSVDPTLTSGTVSLVLGKGFTGLRDVTAPATTPAGGSTQAAPTSPAPATTAAQLTGGCTY
ncbi:LCP family protein [Pseudofrankia inefficax]|uniref:Cell envelope-related transcriptional attenuator n=1 Tax=Pseudofrankia inefficax (strain DSM 45817 / CECT 9037 / DDB 130130 / EuI1c) TaxID=298654 RepID=E3J1Y7_PSEI1|nr:LCP family protein [Pseudofrankia inefficax]ADP84092.1 cell envelope-related transcriptional attenuator [Pseudofrankia inefficax]